MNTEQQPRIDKLKKLLESFNPEKRTDQALLTKLLIDKDVRDPKNKSLGWLEDVFFDGRNGKLLYFIIARKKFLFSRRVQRFLCPLTNILSVDETDVFVSSFMIDLKRSNSFESSQFEDDPYFHLISIRTVTSGRVKELNQDDQE